MHYRVLIVDDELELSEYTSKYFNMSGVSATYATDMKSALAFFEENTCSLVLLDINLGEDSGFELCQIIRQKMNVPIFFISARQAEDDMLLALSIGGDDYICKPYSLSVLLAKVKAALKRYEEGQDASSGNALSQGSRLPSEEDTSHLVQLGSVKVDLHRAVVIKKDREVPLKAMEFRLLVYMLNNRNRIIKKEEFFEKIWGSEFVGDVTLNVHIRHLREKIEEDPGNPSLIKTVWGTGFILEEKK